MDLLLGHKARRCTHDARRLAASGSTARLALQDIALNRLADDLAWRRGQQLFAAHREMRTTAARLESRALPLYSA
jgi:hypothetical protein